MVSKKNKALLDEMVKHSEIKYFYENILEKKSNETNSKLSKIINEESEISRFLPIKEAADLQCISRIKEQEKIGLIADTLIQRRTLQKIEKLLVNLNIEIIVLKGNALNGYIYEYSYPRATTDIDILIRLKDKKKLIVELEKKATKYNKDNQNPYEELYEETWIWNESQVIIDLHTNITNFHLFDIDTEYLFQNTITHPQFNENKILILNNCMQIIHLSIHAFTDAYLPHHSLIDIKKIASLHIVDEKELMTEARKLKCSKITQFMYQEAITLKFPAPKKYSILNLFYYKTIKDTKIDKIKRLFLQAYFIDNKVLVLKNLSMYYLILLKRYLNFILKYLK